MVTKNIVIQVGAKAGALVQQKLPSKIMRPYQGMGAKSGDVVGPGTLEVFISTSLESGDVVGTARGAAYVAPKDRVWSKNSEGQMVYMDRQGRWRTADGKFAERPLPTIEETPGHHSDHTSHL